MRCDVMWCDVHVFPPLQLNWYSKRALLAGVYVSTELFMLSDRSLDYISTWDFLDRRLNDVYQIGKLPKQVGIGCCH